MIDGGKKWYHQQDFEFHYWKGTVTLLQLMHVLFKTRRICSFRIVRLYYFIPYNDQGNISSCPCNTYDEIHKNWVQQPCQIYTSLTGLPTVLLSRVLPLKKYLQITWIISSKLNSKWSSFHIFSKRTILQEIFLEINIKTIKLFVMYNVCLKQQGLFDLYIYQRHN